MRGRTGMTKNGGRTMKYEKRENDTPLYPLSRGERNYWIPAFAGMTKREGRDCLLLNLIISILIIFIYFH
jgi:hypothetical protein